jgi:EAL domain-containing protein (putative c-di-GMP-specific phosphodiesterase class I)
LRFEVNESVLLQAKDIALQQLRQLVELGYSVTLDNFGTGVGSVGCLQSFPFHCVKLAGAIVREIDQPGPQRDLVGGLVYLVRRLGLGVVAEGVETESQRAALAAEECAFMQGHLFSSPSPPEQFIEQWRRHQAASVSTSVLTTSGAHGTRLAV